MVAAEALEGGLTRAFSHVGKRDSAIGHDAHLVCEQRELDTDRSIIVSVHLFGHARHG